ncbi:MAG: spermidine/putrescine ABC transporter substrate-binding protein [Hahellaceae bacterium]|nr:spermidine/putrescine ABC transporter substrate-binding protein [Hahellaceae bacterium]
MLVCVIATFPLRVDAAQQVAPSDAVKNLVLYNWEDYMDPELLAQFEQETGIHVDQIYYETDELKDQFLLTTEGKGIDLVVTSGISLYSYIPAGWLSVLDDQFLSNAGNVDQRWTEFNTEAANYAVPLLWGTLGIAYRKDKILEPVHSWMDLFEPKPYLNQKIMMIDDSRDSMGMALKALGYSINSEDVAELKQATALLKKQKPFVSAYSYLNLGENSELVTGRIWMAMAYSGDVQLLKQYKPEIEYALPKEGTNLWVDYIAVVARSERKVAAMQFINFLLDPKHAAQLSSYTSTATTVGGAKAFLSEEHLGNELIYPKAEALSHSESYHSLSSKGVRLRNIYFSEVNN